MLLILIASINVSITKMTCLLSGKVKYSLEKMENCMPTEGCESIQEKCCDFNKITLDYDYNSIINVSSFDLSSFVFVVFKAVITEVELFNPLSLVCFYTNSSPPLGGYDLLKFIQVFRL